MCIFVLSSYRIFYLDVTSTIIFGLTYIILLATLIAYGKNHPSSLEPPILLLSIHYLAIKPIYIATKLTIPDLLDLQSNKHILSGKC